MSRLLSLSSTRVTPDMSLLYRIIDVLSSIFCGEEDEKKPFLPKNKMLVLKSDGSWLLCDDVSSPEPVLPPLPVPYSGPVSYAPPLISSRDDEELPVAPKIFPHAEQLQNKLDECLAAGVITECTHLQTSSNIYILKVQIPITTTQAQHAAQVKLFIKTMNDKYELKLAHREVFHSTVTSAKHHTIVFEYDAREHLFKPKS